LKYYLPSPPILRPPSPDKHLILYISVLDDSVGAVLAQEDLEGRGRAAYYLSRLLNPIEQRYTAMEKTCAALVWANQKLKHYFLAHKVQLIAKMNPIKFFLEKSIITDRLARWQSFLSQFDITYIQQKAIKGYAIVEHLAHHPRPLFDPVRSECSN